MLHQMFFDKTIQVSLVAGVLFFIVSHQKALKTVGDSVKDLTSVSLKGDNLLLLHSVVFALLVSLTVYYVFEPFVRMLRVRNVEDKKKVECPLQ